MHLPFLGISITISCTIIGTIANSLSLRYFYTKSNIFFKAFHLTAVCDILICLLSVSYGLSFVDQRDSLMLQNHLWFKIWTLLWKFLTRASVHLVAVQSVMRAYAVSALFRKISKNFMIIVLLLDITIFLLPILVIPLVSCTDIYLGSDRRINLIMGLYQLVSLFLLYRSPSS